MTKATDRLEPGDSGQPRVSLPTTLFLQNRLLLNRELSWLEFNRRVLEEALDQSQPLLERLKFLAIFSTNLDEFFMIRVSGLKQQLDAEVTEPSPDGLTAAVQLRRIGEELRPMLDEHMRCLNEQVLPELASAGISITPYRALSDRERRSLSSYFLENVFPVLTPQAVDPSHPFPYVSNLSLNLGVMIEHGPDYESSGVPAFANEARFARVKVPAIVPRLVPVNGWGIEFTYLEDVIAANIHLLFSGMQVGECHAFRVTRDADIEIKEDEANDLLRVMQEQLRKRRFGLAVRLEVSSTMPPEMVRYLTESVGCTPGEVYAVTGPLRVPDLMEIYRLDRPEFKDPVLVPATPTPLRGDECIFDVIRRRDVLLHHPYQTFDSVIELISGAATDPDVLAIKMTLYRTGQDSPIVAALMEASERGKQVAVLVELKARFDEENNIEWARRLERAGVHVVYGLLGLKTHCKLALVVRRESGGLRRYVHIGTGNYNPGTARIYTDLGLLTSNEQIGADATDLFNHLTGFSRHAEYRRMLVAPTHLRRRFTELIEREIQHNAAGRPARIILKINSLTDTKMIRALYEASQAGVKIDLLVRGICTLRPGLPGLSSTITVRSIVGRFLEHSRIFCFANGGDDEIYIGSADWMLRNLDRRVEMVAPVEDPDIKNHLKDDILDTLLKDNVKARVLQPDGSYERITRSAGEEPVDSQSLFLKLYGSH